MSLKCEYANDISNPKYFINFQSFFTYIKVFSYDCLNLNQILLIRSGDVGLMPDPKKSSSLTFFRWNLKGIATQDSKISLTQSYARPRILVQYFYLKFLDSSIEASNPNINIISILILIILTNPGYNSLRYDHPSNSKTGGVSMLYKD